MAKEFIEVVRDDMTGNILEDDKADSITFAVDGVEYELYSTPDVTDKIREFLAPFAAAATRVEETKPQPQASSARRSAGRPSAKRRGEHPISGVRAWANENDYEVSDKGRVPLEIQEAYAKAHGIHVNDIG